MNERIKDLAEQAFFETEYDDVQDLRETMERFAQLIIRECCLLTEQYQHRVTSYRADETIKKHFGVEE